ncbi:hypothetical protein BOTBODRAFT_487757 [Botryobasidium botryosum FD-172 SS1]|uniref:WH1 domain-containing protein n=1 Tax=Botryobasidium botryosum (strain FD-172 SS1) TaxID=930990 RepID=A0A067M7J8_BOTB1|nr:hypothetical protein BOTBODRAFT_487757 [Botryobasidium botryosum FD-172 SS1]
MPARSTLSSANKDRVELIFPRTNYTILTATLARIYYAYPNPKEWSYSGLQGALAFVYDHENDAFWFHLVDISGTRGVTWEHEVYEAFKYHEDRPFFHSFAGDEYEIGFVFAEEAEAAALYKKVRTREREKIKTSKFNNNDESPVSIPKTLPHIGYDGKAGVSSHIADESWQEILDKIAKTPGVTPEMLKREEKFLREHYEHELAARAKEKEQKASSPLASRRPGHGSSSSISASSAPPTPASSTPVPPLTFLRPPPPVGGPSAERLPPPAVAGHDHPASVRDKGIRKTADRP